MFKKSGTKSGSKSSKAQNNELALLIARMQKNADQVEKHIYFNEEKLALDEKYLKSGQRFQYEKDNSEALGESEMLLKDLFLDADKAKKMNHPQATEIEQDIKNLHERWSKNCSKYRDVYENKPDVPLSAPSLDWMTILGQKQIQVNQGSYPVGLPEMEKQIAEHNILHKQIEEYGPQIEQTFTGKPEDKAAILKQHAALLESSKQRKNHLASLYGYLQGCTKELLFLSENQDKILNEDWSDHMNDHVEIRREYENFKTNSLLDHEGEVNKLLDKGDKLLMEKHPASSTIQAHRDALQTEWQDFLNLCVCKETHLHNVEDYKKFYEDVDSASQAVKKQNADLDSKVANSNSSSEIQRYIEREEKSVQQNERLLADLRKRAPEISPLKQRHTMPSRPVTVESLCDWNTDKDFITRGERYNLKDNRDNDNWVVQDVDGVSKTLPGVCFQVLPPDPEATSRLDRLNKDLNDLKNKRTNLQNNLKSQNLEVSRSLNTAPLMSSGDEPQARKLGSRLEDINNNLEQCEKDIVTRLRAPVSRSAAPQDISKRLQDQENTSKTLQSLSMEKDAVKRDIDDFLSRRPTGPSASALPAQLDKVQNKCEEVTALSSLYTQKANASLNLENQMKKVDSIISGMESNLAKDTGIPSTSDGIQIRNQELQRMKKDLSNSQDELQKLQRDYAKAEQQSSALQKGYQEYCPDIKRQQLEVQKLNSRYANVANQLEHRDKLIKEAELKNMDFQNANKSLSNYMSNIPNNKPMPYDSLTEVNNKLNSQKRVVDELKRKNDDVDRAVKVSQDLQALSQEYDAHSDKYRMSLEPSIAAQDSKKQLSTPLKDSIQKQEKDLVNQYTKVSAENEQLLSQLQFAKNVKAQKEEQVNEVVVKQQVHQENLQKSLNEVENLKKDLDDEVSKRSKVNSELEDLRKKLLFLKSRRGVERLEEKEVVQYYRDPKLESDLSVLRSKIQDESTRRSTTQSEVVLITQKIAVLEKELKSVTPQLLTKEVTRIEKDPQLDQAAADLRKEIQRLREEVHRSDSDTVRVKTEVNVLSQKKPNVKEKVVTKEVVKFEKDPEMLKAVREFQTMISDESEKSKKINDLIFQTRSQINTLERIIPTLEPKVVTKELKKVEQDPELINESSRLRSQLQDERNKNSSLLNEISSLQIRYREVEQLKPKVQVKEVVSEIFRVDPETETEVARLKRELQGSSKHRAEMEREINQVTIDLQALRSQKPKVELKEVTQEVLKMEMSPEIQREIEKLKQQLRRLNDSHNQSEDLLLRLRKERDEWKAEKSKVETKLVNKEFIKYENDPLLEKEAERLRREMREEAQKRRAIEELVFDLQNKHILMERQKPPEKVVVQEILRLQKDPKQFMEHDKLSKDLDEEIKSRRRLELEIEQLRTLILEKERSLNLEEERSKKITLETELRQIKMRIKEIEMAPAPVEERIIMEEVLKVERDPYLDKASSSMRVDIERERNEILRLERELRTLQIKIEILQREKTVEKTVYKEVIRVEKDKVVQNERLRIRDQLNQERNARRNAEDEIRRLTERITRLDDARRDMSREEKALTQTRDSLLQEKNGLAQNMNNLQTEKQQISISYKQQSKLMNEKSQQSRQKGIQLESMIQKLEQDILQEKDTLNQRELTIKDLQNTFRKEEAKHSEKQTRETNLSTRISILDPETGKDMSPYEAYKQGLIDRNQYLQLEELECDWEEITTLGPDGEVSVLQDRKSGKQYSIKDAIRERRVTAEEVRLYKDGKIPISEFALLVAGESKPKDISTFMSKSPLHSPTTQAQRTFFQSSSPPTSFQEDNYPIAGIYDTNTDSRISIRNAMNRKMIDPITGNKLLEAQAATGGIVDVISKDRYSVHKAAERGLIESTHLQRLLNAQKAYTGVEDPVTKERLSVGEAAQKGWMPRDSALAYMEAQVLTGGLVDPKRTGRINITDAIQSNMVDSATAKMLQDDSAYPKDIIDPVSKEKINYKEAMARCQRDPSTGLLLLPAVSTNSISYPSYRPVNRSLLSSGYGY
ncbi:envoplakin a [Polypterus senegalus]|nr:envoplakin a [Polypterus senegalus]